MVSYIRRDEKIF